MLSAGPTFDVDPVAAWGLIQPGGCPLQDADSVSHSGRSWRYNSPMVSSPGQTVATSPLLETKLYIPRWRTGLVPRARLIERLDRGLERKLTLVSAPAGFGKSTVLAEWAAGTPADERPAAWVSLDQSDNDPALFWAYFITALQTVHSGLGESARSLLRSAQPPPIEVLLGLCLTRSPLARRLLRQAPR